MAEQEDRGLKHLNHAVKSGSGETSKRLVAKDDVKDPSFRRHSNRTGHHASRLRRYTRYVIDSYFNCCIGNGYRRRCCCCCSYCVLFGSAPDPAMFASHVPTFNNNNEFGRNTNTPELFSTVGPVDVVYGPEGGTACYGGGTGQTNQLVSVSTSNNHPNMNSSGYSKKNQRSTINGNTIGTQDDNISTIRQRSIIDDGKANETPIVVKEGKAVGKGIPGQGLKKWLCLGWLANKR